MPFIRYATVILVFIFGCMRVGAQTVCPPNLDFELGNYSRWTFYTGTCCPIVTATQVPPINTPPTRHFLTSGTGVDPYGGFPVVATGSGLYALRLGNDQTGRQAERARYYVQVPANVSTYVLMFRYAVVFQDPNHPVVQQPRFEVSAYDSATGDLIPCSDVTYVSSASLPGFQLAPTGTQVYYKDWSAASIFLGDEVAGKTVAVDFSTGDCGAGAHFGYAYVDMNCDILQTYYNMTCSPQQTVTLNAPPGYQFYQWMDSSMKVVLNSNQTFLTSVPDSSTVYALILTPFANFGCKDTIFAKVANLRVFASDDTVVCLNGGVGKMQLNARAKGDAGPFIYNWFPAAGLSCTNCANPVATIDTTAMYYVTATDTNGCTKIDSVLLTVSERVEANIGATPDTICQFEAITIEEVSTNPAGTQHFWDVDTGNIVSGDGTKNIVASWGNFGPKKIRLKTANNGCEWRDSVDIYVKEGPQAFFDIKHNVCVDEVVRLYTKEYNNSTYYWTIDEQSIPDISYQEYRNISWNTPGKKSAKLKVTAENGCSAGYDTVVRVHSYPEGKIKVDDMSDFCAGDTVKLYTTPLDFATYTWGPTENIVGSNVPEVKAVFSQSTVATLDVKTQWGCNTTDSMVISTANCCKVVAPDAFTPNNDGYNDRFSVIPQGQNTVHTFIITNRWGNVVYDSRNYDGWDGTYKGIAQDPGVYNYYVKFICNSGKIQEAKGAFLLIK